MRPTYDTFPVFEANQVLTNTHLNQVFRYLDEQERLTRANLIGIGIVCGLDIRLEATAAATTIHLTKGCGISSEGYLLVEPDDVALVAYRPGYKAPNDLSYPPFTDSGSRAQYPLWELLPAGEPDATPLGAARGFLDDKAVLLFLELKKEGLRTCGPNNCDDKGASVTATVRRLLIQVTDLTRIIAAANKLDRQLTPTDLAATLSARLRLPDLRLPRYDVPNTQPATSAHVLAGFFEVFQGEKLASQLGAALTAAYQAFRPTLEADYAANPFAGFGARFGFLDTAPATTGQVRFLPYYYDFFDDLLGAYEEFRWKGLDLLCACCPSAELFPRHLMLGVLAPAAAPNPAVYRHAFLPSSAISGCEEQTQELISLFRRLVEMVTQFTDSPPLAASTANARLDAHIRITPSKLAAVPLSEKAIPYYYHQAGTPPLHQLWSPEKTRRGRANQNLSYRAEEYAPAPPQFVLQPLGYDLEPYNFLRIEGHLGKPYQSALSALLSLKTRYRLPIEVIALRTGAFDEKQLLPARREDCWFQDLEALYATLKAELTAFLAKEAQYFYGLPLVNKNSTSTGPTKPKLPLLAEHAPDFRVQPRTLGRLVEDALSAQPGGVFPDIDPSGILDLLAAVTISQDVTIIAFLVVYLEKLYEQLPAELGELDFSAFEKRFRDLTRVTEAIERERDQGTGTLEGSANVLSWEELDDRVEAILYSSQREAFAALWQEYRRRLREVKQKQFLSYFLQANPGIQHKAGVPLGGTFILVYHDDPDPTRPTLGFNQLATTSLAAAVGSTVRNQPMVAANVNTAAVSAALARISADRQLIENEDLRFLLGTFTGVAPERIAVPPRPNSAEKIIASAVAELADGTVIADFFLPYICCSDCMPVQFVLPKLPPSFSVQLGCTNPNNEAEVAITPAGGTGPYSLKIDKQDYQPLKGTPLLSAGQHTLVLRDAEAAESAPQTITIAPQLLLGRPTFDCVDGRNEYVATFRVEGGTPPYAASRGTIEGNTYASDPLPGDTEIEIVVTDSRRCAARQQLSHSCRSSFTFRVKVGCTTRKKEAAVEILPTGGTAPYQVQVGTTPPATLSGPLALAVGTHTIVVRDAAGAESAPQTVVVPEPLTATEVDFSCEGTTYQSIIRIEGGTPPYVAAGKPVLGNSFTTDAIASGTKESVVVTDSKKCKTEVTVEHACDEPCNLPCGGQSRRCAYRLWLQPPTADTPYRMYRPAAVKFRFNGQEIKLPDTTELLLAPVEQLNENFREAIGRIIKKLSEVLNQALIETLGEAGNNRLAVSYEPAETDPFGVFWLEYFECETFSIEFNYSFGKPTPAFTLTMRYTNEPDVTGAPFNGALLTNRRANNQETRVPAFDCRERNQCTGSEYQKLCEGPEPKPALTVEALGNNNFRLAGQAANVPASEVAAWVWDAPAAQAAEPFYEGQQVEAQLLKFSGAVQLTVITRKGCFGVVEQETKP